MDPNFRIYEDDPERIPPEDKARLEGFLKGVSEANEKERVRQIQAELEELKANLQTAPPEPNL